MTLVTPLKRILVPIDLSDASRPVLEYALALAGQLGASLDLIYVWIPPRFISPELSMAAASFTMGDLEGRAITEAKKEIEQLIQSVDRSGVPVRAFTEIGAIVPSILRLVEREHPDLIVMGTHGRSGLERVLLGSVAQHIVAHAPCPVLTLNPYSPTKAVPHVDRRDT